MKTSELRSWLTKLRLELVNATAFLAEADMMCFHFRDMQPLAMCVRPKLIQAEKALNRVEIGIEEMLAKADILIEHFARADAVIDAALNAPESD